MAVERPKPMQLLRIYARPDGASHVDEIEVPQPPGVIFPGAGPLHRSSIYGPTGMPFMTVPAGLQAVRWHHPPERRFGIVLRGVMACETRASAVHRLSPGRVVLVEDTWGKGHIARCPHEETVAFIAAPAAIARDT